MVERTQQAVVIRTSSITEQSIGGEVDDREWFTINLTSKSKSGAYESHILQQNGCKYVYTKDQFVTFASRSCETAWFR